MGLSVLTAVWYCPLEDIAVASAVVVVASHFAPKLDDMYISPDARFAVWYWPVDDIDMLFQPPEDTPFVIAVQITPKLYDTYIDSPVAQAL